MKIYKYIICSLFLAVSCQDLEVEQLNAIESKSVYENQELMAAHFSYLQGRLPYGICANNGNGSHSDMQAAITDEARSKSGWVANNKVIKGLISPTQAYGYGIWKRAYKTIRATNEALMNLETSPLEESYKNDIIAKIRYIRAFTYFDVVRRYGAIPLLTVAQSLDDDLQVNRTPVAEIYAFIHSELELAADGLKAKSASLSGAINKQAAIALSARASLYAENWAESARLADLLITGENNDGLNLHPDYRELFLSKGGINEVIMEKQTYTGVTGQSFALYNLPVRWRSNWGGQTDPTQQMVDSYQMLATGLDISDPASGYDPENPYTGRDKRFNASIFYHGSDFDGLLPKSGAPYIDMEWNNMNEGPGKKKSGAASITGYLVRKWADPSDGLGPERYNSFASWKEIRYAEVLLIYAEASNEDKGPSQKVYDAINTVRNRAGLPNLIDGFTKEQMRMAIRQERKVELAFENHRWFDLIRWKIAKEVLDGFVPKGVKITRKSNAPSNLDTPQLFDSKYLTFDTSYIVSGRTSVFPDSYYLMPIPQSELDKNSNLKPQNPGY